MAKKILIAGYYGMNNLGDELILEFLLKDLRQQEGFEITVLSGSPDLTSKYYNVKSLPRTKIFAVIKAIYKSDIIIVGGGGLFQDKTSNLSLYYYLSIVLLGKLLAKRVAVYSVGIDKLKIFNTKLTSCIIKLADYISVRDTVSYKFLAGVEYPAHPRIFFMPDVVLNHKPAMGTKIQKQQMVFGFIIRKIGGDSAEFWAILADSCIRRFRAAVKFVVFHKLMDYEYTRDIVSMMKNSAEIVLWEKPSDVLKEFYNFDFVISARLHGMILAATYGIPVCGVSDELKSSLFLKEIEQKNIYSPENFNDSSYETIMGLISDTWQWQKEFREKCVKNIERLQKQYKVSWNEFVNFLTNAA